jgi:hypothetical protein
VVERDEAPNDRFADGQMKNGAYSKWNDFGVLAVYRFRGGGRAVVLLCIDTFAAVFFVAIISDLVFIISDFLLALGLSCQSEEERVSHEATTINHS